MSDTPIPDRMRSRQMPDVVSFRAHAGFNEEVRAAARSRGERPGEFIRRALRDRIGGEGTDMTRETFYAAISALAEGGDIHPGLRTALSEFSTEKLPAFKEAFFERLTVAHDQLGKCLVLASDFESWDSAPDREEVRAAGALALVAAFSAMDEAREIRSDLVHLAFLGTDA